MKQVAKLLLLMALALPLTGNAAEKAIKVLTYDGIINPIAAEYLGGNIAKINDRASAELIVIMLDTPGGLDTSMRIIVKEILNSRIPVAVYVAPSGSRAASAGTFITMAAHVAAMAPGTSIGAASPVKAGGGKMDRTMERKVQNDAASYIRSIAHERGRNEEWAEQAVRKAVSADEREALGNKVIDKVAVSLDELLDGIHGKTVKTAAGELTIETKGLPREEIVMTERQKFLNIISNPTVAYILLMLGFYGLLFELQSPGTFVPGIVGAICLILGFYAMQSMPINWAGILLLILAVILFVAEMFVPTFGALTLGGVIAMVLGAVMLVDTEAEYMQVKLTIIVPLALGMGTLFAFLVGWLYLMKPKKVPIGSEGLIGEPGAAHTFMDPHGTIEVEGELWDARSESGPLEKGTPIRITAKEGHILVVEKDAGEETSAPGNEA